ncbi:MAG: hypothetical protein ACPG52_04520 [Cognaticolwellia sp.]
MIIALTDQYQLSITSPLHGTLVLLAFIGLMASCLLAFRRIYRAPDSNVPKVKVNGLNNNGRFTLLILTNIVAFISVLLFVLPLDEQVQTPSFDVLLTSGIVQPTKNEPFNLNELTSAEIQQALTSAEHIWLLEEQNNKTDNGWLRQWLMANFQEKVIRVNSVPALTALWQQGITQPSLLQVFGDGLSEQQWQRLSEYNADNTIEFSFFASAPRLGVVKLDWPRQLVLGQALTVTGQLQASREENRQFTLSLRHHEQVLASTVISGGESFSLSATSKISGLFNYQLVLTPLNEKLSEKLVTKASSKHQPWTRVENIAFSVVNGNQPQVLIKQSAPSFETRRLKQWLSQANSPVHIISQVSQNKWAQQKVNMTAMGENNISESALSETRSQQQLVESHLLNEKLLRDSDVLLMDSRMLLALEAEEVDAVYQAVNQGLGLFINADSSLLSAQSVDDKRNKILNLFSLAPADDTLEQVFPYWPAQPSQDVSQVIAPQSASIKITAKAGQSLVESATGQALVVKQAFGAGTVALSTLNETYQWALQAEPTFYSHYWQYLFAKIARSDDSTRWLLPAPTSFSKVQQFHDVCLLSSRARVDSPDIILSEYPLSGDKKCGQLLPQQPGWYVMQAFADEQTLLAEQARYYYAGNDFSAWQQANKRQAGASYAGITALSYFNKQLAERYQAANKVYLWLLMFIALSLLWFERKWYGS